jgi:hypothetical protein
VHERCRTQHAIGSPHVQHVHTHACTHSKHHQRTKARTHTLCPSEPIGAMRIHSACSPCMRPPCMHAIRSRACMIAVHAAASVFGWKQACCPAFAISLLQGRQGGRRTTAPPAHPPSRPWPDAPRPPPQWAARWVLTSRDACGHGCGSDVVSAAARLSGVCARLQGGRWATHVHAQDVPQRTGVTAVSFSSSIDPRHIRRCAQQRPSGLPPSCAAHFRVGLAHCCCPPCAPVPEMPFPLAGAAAVCDLLCPSALCARQPVQGRHGAACVLTS